MDAPLEPQGASGVGAVDGSGVEQVDQRIATWRQGDCVVADDWFLFRVNMDNPLTADGEAAVVEGAENAETSVRGFAVLTQTCDLVRSCAGRPFAEVSPLVEVNDRVLREIERGRRPDYGFIPGVADQRLVADLDRVMTVEKAVVAAWEQIDGCQTEEDARRLSLALARKRSRTAFPDDFVEFARPLMDRMSERHDRQSDEGRVLRSLREVRVRAAPSWDETEDAEHCLTALPQAQPAPGRFVRVDGVVLTLDDLTARDYVESDPLDLDHLSTRRR
ncbi:hypothetical protein [Candidatus Palauibacter sp.]|uniref:hypothetical protein n=1 Tax=Candidatus Palauibacter sp. TaxID=3101350 RepID=UPI003D1346CE